jgi:hypothetical protein
VDISGIQGSLLETILFLFLYCTTLETFLFADNTSALKSKNNLPRKRQLRLGNLEIYFNNNDPSGPNDPATRPNSQQVRGITRGATQP